MTELLLARIDSEPSGGQWAAGKECGLILLRRALVIPHPGHVAEKEVPFITALSMKDASPTNHRLFGIREIARTRIGRRGTKP